MTIDLNEYEIRRQAERLARAKTDAQRETMQRLHAERKDAWPERRQGKTVVSEFRRYVETCDAEKIGEGLYHWSTMGGGGLNEIAHFDIHGFRNVYRHPALYIEQLLIPEVERWPESFRQDPNGYHSLHVYTDGMTSGEVAHAIIDLAAEHRERVLANYKSKRDASALEKASELAESLGMKLVPQ